RLEFDDALVHTFANRVVADKAAFELGYRQRQPRQLRVVALAGQVVAQQQQAGAQVAGAAVDLLGRGGVDPEHAVERGVEHGGVGLAGFGDAPHLPERLHHSGQGEDAVVGHAAIPRWRRSSGASVAAITAPPRQTSSWYSTTDWPGVTARCGLANAMSSCPLDSSMLTWQGSSGCR